MINRFLDLDVQLRAAHCAVHGAGRRSRIRRCAAARSEFLRIAALIFNEPRRRFQELEVAVGHHRRGADEQRRGIRQSNQFH